METLIDLIRDASNKYGDRLALSIRRGLREDSWSYVRVWRAANAVARHLRQEVGLRPGDRVLIWGANCPQLVVTYFGAMLARLVLVPLDPYSTNEFINRVAEKTQAAAIITGFKAPTIAGLRTESLWDLPFEEGTTFGEQPGGKEIAEIVFTSGTTGNPKGVILTHSNIVSNVLSARSIIPQGPHYRLLSVLPLSHMLEQTAGLYLPLLYGATVHYPTSRQSSVIFKTLKRHRIVMMVAVPQLLKLMLQGIERQVRRQGKTHQWEMANRLAEQLPFRIRRWMFRNVRRELGGCLDFFVCGGAYLPPELASAWERMGVRVVQGYGATECAPIVAANSLRKRVLEAVGRPPKGVQVRLSAEGEILVKGANVTEGYWNDEKATRAAFAEDGWYRTGDLGEWDEKGNLYLKGRLTDRIVLPSGLNVYPEDVEQILSMQEGVAECVVVGVRDTTGNTHVHAALIPIVDGRDEQTIRELMNQGVRNANAHLAPHQRISGFTVWEGAHFPRTNLLKVKRHEVSATLAGQVPTAASTSPPPGAEQDRFLRLKRILGEVGGVSTDAITPKNELGVDLNLDSLSRVELAVVLEEELGVAVEEEELAGVSTMGQLIGLIDQAETAKEAVQFPAWALRSPTRLARVLLQHALVFPIHGLVSRSFTVEGSEHLQGMRSPALFIANHNSHLDTPSILRALPLRVRCRLAIAAAADYFYSSRLIGAGMSLLLNAFPFSRQGAVRSSLEHCGELVDAGWSILIYPEGTRSTTGEVLPFKSGIGLLATELRVPVVPIAIEGTHHILPKGRRWPRRGPVHVRIGNPISLPQSAGHVTTASFLERAVLTLMNRHGPRHV